MGFGERRARALLRVLRRLTAWRGFGPAADAISLLRELPDQPITVCGHVLQLPEGQVALDGGAVAGRG